MRPWEPGEGPQRYIRELEAENERLRAALQEIERWNNFTSLSEPRLIARRALGADEQPTPKEDQFKPKVITCPTTGAECESVMTCIGFKGCWLLGDDEQQAGFATGGIVSGPGPKEDGIAVNLSDTYVGPDGQVYDRATGKSIGVTGATGQCCTSAIDDLIKNPPETTWPYTKCRTCGNLSYRRDEGCHICNGTAQS